MTVPPEWSRGERGKGKREGERERKRDTEGGREGKRESEYSGPQV